MRALFLVLFAVILTVACVVGPAPSGTSLNLEAARKVSDSFMTDLVSDRVDLALDEMEPEFVDAVGRAEAEAAIRKLFDYCGRPLDQEFKHDEIGTRLDVPHGKRPMRKFYYAARTSMHPKGVCFFGIEVVPSKDRLRVAVFGPLKLQWGELPDWAK